MADPTLTIRNRNKLFELRYTTGCCIIYEFRIADAMLELIHSKKKEFESESGKKE